MKNEEQAVKVENHFYIYNGKRYENMKDACESTGTGITSRFFKHCLRTGIITKHIEKK